MRSPGSESRARLPFERLARVAALALLAVALWRALATFAADGPPRLHAALDGDVTAVQRDSLAALARAGTAVTWSGDLRTVAAMAEPVREPAAGWRISVVADSGVRVADDLGALDSLGSGGGAVRAAGVRGELRAREGPTGATVGAPAAISLGRVLVYSRAGWEAKFAIAALEEQGWEVDARLTIGDGVTVTQGSSAAPSVARHAAVVVLDTAVGREAAAIARFVRAGGGLLLAGEGADAPSLRALAPARVARVAAPATRSFEGEAEPTDALPLHALGTIRPDGVVMATRGTIPAVAARRVGAGRVVQMGYAETWRWRMQGEGRSVEEHRAFWSRMVGAAAAARAAVDDARAITAAGESGAAVASPNSSPYAQAVQALGAPIASAPRGVARQQGPALPVWLGPLVLVLLVAEWASRRTRGAM